MYILFGCTTLPVSEFSYCITLAMHVRTSTHEHLPINPTAPTLPFAYAVCRKGAIFGCFYLLSQTCFGLQTWRFHCSPQGTPMWKSIRSPASLQVSVGSIWYCDYVPLAHLTNKPLSLFHMINSALPAHTGHLSRKWLPLCGSGLPFVCK